MKFRKPRISAGLTLVEVIAAMALLGMLLVLFVRASQQQIHAAKTSKEKILAIRAADRLMARWTSSGSHIPVNAHGQTDLKGLFWETKPGGTVHTNPRLAIIQLTLSMGLNERRHDVLRLELIDPS